MTPSRLSNPSKVTQSGSSKTRGDMVIYNKKYTYLVFVLIPGAELLKPLDISK